MGIKRSGASSCVTEPVANAAVAAFAASSADTPTAVAVQAVSANIYTSSTGDATVWQDRSYAGSWSSVVVDASGKYMAAARSSGQIWYSQDKGATWTAIANSGSRNWVSVHEHQQQRMLMHGDGLFCAQRQPGCRRPSAADVLSLCCWTVLPACAACCMAARSPARSQRSEGLYTIL